MPKGEEQEADLLKTDARVHAFPDAGHYVLEDAGDEALRVLRDFLSGA